MPSATRSSERRPVRLVVISLTVLLFLRCERPVNPFGPQRFYVSTISGLSVRETAGIHGRLIDLLAYNESVQIIEKNESTENFGGRKGSWVKIQYSEKGLDGETKGKEGWVFDGYLSARPMERYFRVQAVDGLEVREKPDLRAKVLGRLAYEEIGIIETAGRRLDMIRGQRGFWFRTEFEDTEGWAFSGSVVLSDRRYDLERHLQMELDDRELEETDRSLEDILAGASIVTVIQLRDFRVHEVRFQLRDQDLCDRPESALVFERLRDGQLFITGGFSARIESKDYPLEGALLMRSRECSCCCASDRLQAVFPDRAGPRVIDYHQENLEARCEIDPLGKRRIYRSENRTDPESGDLFLYWQDPDCGSEEEDDTSPARRTTLRKSIRIVQDFRHDIFARIRFVDGRLRIDRYQDRSIPPSLREAWERSDPL